MKQARMYQYNLGIEQQLPWNMAITVAYAGSRGYNLPNTQEGNPVIPQGVPGANGACNIPAAGHVPNTTSMVDGSGATACWLAADASGTLPPAGVTSTIGYGSRTNPNFGSMDLFTDRAQSWYNSAQITIIKSLSNGLQFQSSYTYSKTVDTQAGAAFAENTASQAADGDDTFNINNERGPTVYDLPNVWKFNVLYNVPSPIHEGIGHVVLGGWRLSSITTVQSGFPFSLGLNTERSRSGVENASAGVDRPDYSSSFTNIYNITHGTSAGCSFTTGVAPNQVVHTIVAAKERHWELPTCTSTRARLRSLTQDSSEMLGEIRYGARTCAVSISPSLRTRLSSIWVRAATWNSGRSSLIS